MLSRNHQAMGKGTRLDHMFCTAILRKWMEKNTTGSAPLVVSQKEEGTSTFRNTPPKNETRVQLQKTCGVLGLDICLAGFDLSLYKKRVILSFEPLITVAFGSDNFQSFIPSFLPFPCPIHSHPILVGNLPKSQ